MLNLTCFFGFSLTGVGALLCHTLLLDSQVLECNFRSLMWRQRLLTCSIWSWRTGDCPQCCGEEIWCHVDLLLLLDWEYCFCDLDHPVGKSSLGHLATSLPCGSAEGEYVCNAEQPHEHLLFLEGPAEPGAPCRPALDIHWFNSCLSSLQQSSCCWQESMLWANVHSPW